MTIDHAPFRPILSRRAALIAGTAAVASAALDAVPRALSGSPARLGPLRPTAYRFTLGAFEITTISDGTMPMDGPFPIFGENQTAEIVGAFASAHMLPPDKLVVGFSPALVNTGGDLVLFDTGLGAAERPNAGFLAERLRTSGIDPAGVSVVVVTHFHADHIGGLMTDGRPTFPNARYVWSEVEYAFWSAPERTVGPTAGTAALVKANVVPLAGRATFLKDGSEVASGIRAAAAPGHTPGHTAFHIESNGARLFVGGDFANHYLLSLERPEWHLRFDMDKEKAVATRKGILSMLAADRIPFTSYHMPFPSVGFVEASGGTFRYVPVSYQFDV